MRDSKMALMNVKCSSTWSKSKTRRSSNLRCSLVMLTLTNPMLAISVLVFLL